MKEPAVKFDREADLVAAYCDHLNRGRNKREWTAYHETAGWDLLLVHQTGVQIGIEAKLSLNAKVLEQALPGRWADKHGPDYRAVLVPSVGLQQHLERLAAHVGITVIVMPASRGAWPRPELPDEQHGFEFRSLEWHNWAPQERCRLPEYVPDVTGGKAAPVKLSEWKIKAIKLMILLGRRGAVTRADMSALKISPTRWTDAYYGFLSRGPQGGYVANERTPDIKAQHPTAWAEIEADFDTWSKGLPAAALRPAELMA